MTVTETQWDMTFLQLTDVDIEKRTGAEWKRSSGLMLCVNQSDIDLSPSLGPRWLPYWFHLRKNLYLHSPNWVPTPKRGASRVMCQHHRLHNPTVKQCQRCTCDARAVSILWRLKWSFYYEIHGCCWASLFIYKCLRKDLTAFFHLLRRLSLISAIWYLLWLMWRTDSWTHGEEDVVLYSTRVKDQQLKGSSMSHWCLCSCATAQMF